MCAWRQCTPKSKHVQKTVWSFNKTKFTAMALMWKRCNTDNKVVYDKNPQNVSHVRKVVTRTLNNACIHARDLTHSTESQCSALLLLTNNYN